MKKLKTTLSIESLIKSMKSQALIEGELQRKSAQPEIAQILLVSGRNVITAMDIVDDQVHLEGKTFFNVIYTDMIGELHSFESSAPFHHTLEMKGAKRDFRGFADSNIKDISYRLLPSGAVAVKAFAELACHVWTQEDQDILTEVSSDSDTYVREEGISLPMQTAFKNTLVTLREDIRVPQNMPTINKVLDADGYAVVRSVHIENMKITVEGDVRISVIYESRDKNAPIQHMTATLPFGEIIGIDEVEEGDLASVFTELIDLVASPVEGSDDLIVVDTSFKLITSIYSFKKMNAISDLYSTKSKIECTKEKVNMRGLCCSFCTKTILRAPIELPKSAPDVSRVLFCRANPCVSKATARQGFVEIEGMLYTQICYACANGKLASVSIETPFKTEISAEKSRPGMEVMARVELEYFEVEGSGRDLDAKFSLEITLSLFTSESKELVLDANETDEKVEPIRGIRVYFVQPRESAWDICKRFHITPSALEELNKNTNIANLKTGDKLIIFS